MMSREAGNTKRNRGQFMKHIKAEAFGYIHDMFSQHNMVKRIILSFTSIIIMGLGISLFSVSGFGVDPFTSMNMNIASTLGIGFGTYQLIVNAVILIYVIVVAHRGLVGVGTVFNMVGCGYACEFFQSLIQPITQNNSSFVIRIPLLILGIITLCFACSLFFTANIGVGPYDALGFMLSRGIKLEHKWVRIITDLTVITIGLAVSGGLTALLHGNFGEVRNIGLGTVITALCMGPLVNFFNKHISAKILDVDYEKISRDVAFFMIKGAMVKNYAPENSRSPQVNYNAYSSHIISK